jgi:hypothetical protein
MLVDENLQPEHPLSSRGLNGFGNGIGPKISR